MLMSQHQYTGWLLLQYFVNVFFGDLLRCICICQMYLYLSKQLLWLMLHYLVSGHSKEVFELTKRPCGSLDQNSVIKGNRDGELCIQQRLTPEVKAASFTMHVKKMFHACKTKIPRIQS